MIHLTAIIGSGAKIGTNVEIGPHSIIGGAVSIGDKSVIGANVVIEGEVIVGPENRIAHGTVIGGEPQDLGFSPTTRSRVEIGAKNVIREHCTIHRGTAEGSATKIGDENFLMAGAHVGHNCEIGNKVIIANNCLLGGYVSVGDGAFLGGRLCLSPIHAGGTARDHTGRVRFWQGHPAFRDRGGNAITFSG